MPSKKDAYLFNGFFDLVEKLIKKKNKEISNASNEEIIKAEVEIDKLINKGKLSSKNNNKRHNKKKK